MDFRLLPLLFPLPSHLRHIRSSNSESGTRAMKRAFVTVGTTSFDDLVARVVANDTVQVSGAGRRAVGRCGCLCCRLSAAGLPREQLQAEKETRLLWLRYRGALEPKAPPAPHPTVSSPSVFRLSSRLQWPSHSLPPQLSCLPSQVSPCDSRLPTVSLHHRTSSVFLSPLSLSAGPSPRLSPASPTSMSRFRGSASSSFVRPLGTPGRDLPPSLASKGFLLVAHLSATPRFSPSNWETGCSEALRSADPILLGLYTSPPTPWPATPISSRPQPAPPTPRSASVREALPPQCLCGRPLNPLPCWYRFSLQHRGPRPPSLGPNGCPLALPSTVTPTPPQSGVA